MSREGMETADQIMERYPALFEGCFDYSVPRGWWGLVCDLVVEVDRLSSETTGAQVRVAQVKDKFGTLRFYFQVTREPEVLRGQYVVLCPDCNENR